MRIRALYLLASALLLTSIAQANERAWGYCQNGNQTVVTGGVSSTTKVQGSFPSCTVTVYEVDGVTIATIYSDNLSSPTPKANPFVADSLGFWFFYAANNPYRVKISGGGIPSPVDIGDILLFDPSSASSNIINSADYDFTPISPSGSLIAGSNTVTFLSCPRGVAGLHTVANNLPHLLYIAGTGTPESVAITGGGCTGTGTSGGTIQFTTVGAHSAGYTIESNTDGVQEAVYTAGMTGAVTLPTGDIHLRGNVSTLSALTIPGGYTTALIGQGPLISKFKTHGLTGLWVTYDCIAPCSTGSGGAGGLVTGFSIQDVGAVPHSAGTMLKLRYRSDQIVSNLYINEAFIGIFVEGNARFTHSSFTVGHYKFGYLVSCDGVNYPTCLSFGILSTPTISSAVDGASAIRIEAPTAGIIVDSPSTGAAVNSNNSSVMVVAVGTNPLNEVHIGGACILDGHSVGVQVTGNGSTYNNINSIKIDNCRITASGTGIAATSFVQGLAITNNIITAAAGVAAGVAIDFLGDIARSQITNNSQINADGAACFRTQGNLTDLDFLSNTCGGLAVDGVRPTSALALGGVISGFNVKGNSLAGTAVGAAGIVATSATITGLNWTGNTGSISFPFSSFTACGVALAGQTAPISDSSTAVWGATITGSGANAVMGYCNGTNWTVAAK